MDKNTSVDLSDDFVRFIKTQIDQGRYEDASEVMRAGLRMIEEQEAKQLALVAALIEGEESGPSQRSVTDIWDDVQSRRHHRANG